MNYVEQMIERGPRQGLREGRQEGLHAGRREGELRGQVRTIERLLVCGVPWSTIEAATGIGEDAFRNLKRQLDGMDDGAAPVVGSRNSGV